MDRGNRDSRSRRRRLLAQVCVKISILFLSIDLAYGAFTRFTKVLGPNRLSLEYHRKYDMRKKQASWILAIRSTLLDTAPACSRASLTRYRSDHIALIATKKLALSVMHTNHISS